MAFEWKDKVDGVDDVLAEDINNIAHQVIDNENEILNKVSKENGKGLSSNDFTNEYKNKVDNFKSPVQSVAGKIGDVILDKNDVGLSQVDNTSDLDKPVSIATQKALDEKADKSSVYTKSEVNTELNKKVNKSDISNVYRFKGSVETTDDLPDVYTVKAIGDATDDDGNVVGKYNQETGEFDFDSRFTIPAGAIKNIYIPCTPVVLKPGWYLPLSEGLGDIDVESDVWPLVYCIGRDKGYSDIHSYSGGLFVLSEEFQIKYITVVFDNALTDEPYDASITGTGNIFIDAVKVIYDENDGENWEHCSAPQNGDVYNVLKSGMNYAWTGTGWDALGGEHKDLEAREMIGDIETALDSIIEIQDSLIGGDSV